MLRLVPPTAQSNIPATSIQSNIPTTSILIDTDIPELFCRQVEDISA
jgi:hypothetical protein